MAGEGPHQLEIRNRAERSRAASGTGYVVRFKQLLVPGMIYDYRAIQYRYDALSRLTEARYNPGSLVDVADGDLLRHYQYTYDLAGNRESQSEGLNGGAPVVINYTYNAANQMISDGTHMLTYDPNRNLTGDGVNSYAWDQANRLLSAGGSAYQYDGLGNRIQQTAGATVTRYLLDLQPGLAVVLRQSDGTTNHYIHSLRGIHAQQDNAGDWNWMVPDGLGSVRGVADDTVTTLESRSYAPYGEPFGVTGSNQTLYGFTGEHTDPTTDLLYLRARYYAPGMGVFTALDPFEGMATRPMSLNGYSWVEGNVPNRVDPSGKWGERPEQWDNCNNQSDPCIAYLYRDGYRYADCLMSKRLNPCPVGYAAPMEVPYPRCITPNGLQHAGILWEEHWRAEEVNAAQTRCETLREHARQLIASGKYNGREVLSETIRYAYSTFSYSTARELSDDVSCAVTGARGAETIIQASGFGSQGIGYFEFGKYGWSSSYDDDTANQAFHVWAYVNSAAQGGSLLALLGDFGHECLDVMDAGRTQSDSRLAIAGTFFGSMIRNGFPTDQVDEWVDEWLGNKSFNDLVQGYKLQYLLDMLNIRVCPLIDRNR